MSDGDSDADAAPSAHAGVATDPATMLAMLLLQVAAGDAQAFARLYRATAPRLFGACRRLLPETAEAEEALQDTYLSVWRRAGSFDPARGSAMAWLLTVSRNCAVDRLRARRRFVDAPLDTAAEGVADPAPLAPDRIHVAQERRRMLNCIDALDAGDATLIRAAFYQGSTYAELATRAANPLGTIKSRIRRALMKLGECLR